MTIRCAAAELHQRFVADPAFVCVGAFPGDTTIILYTRLRLDAPEEHGGYPVRCVPIASVRHPINQEPIGDE